MIDFWAHVDISAGWIIKKYGLGPETYESVVVLSDGGMDGCYAFSKDTSEEVVKKFQSVFDELKAKGKYQEILDPYLK